MATNSTITVFGSTGKVGRALVTQLLDHGATVRAVTRAPGTAEFPDAVDVVRGDLLDPASLPAALHGSDTVFLLWPSFDAGGAREAVAVLAAHVRRIVYLSADGAEKGVWGEVEQLVRNSGVDATFLRAGGFAGNTLGWAEQIRTTGVVREPYGGAGRSLVHERDLAAVALRALTTDDLIGASPVLTGPGTLTQIEQAHLIGEAIGRPVRWEEPTRDEARTTMLAAGWDPMHVDSALDAWAGMVTHPEHVTTTVQDITGRPARTFAEWARDHAAAFR